MKATTGPMGGDALTLLDLLRKAATHKGLKLCEGAPTACSEPIVQYALDERLLALFAEGGIRRWDRPDCRDEIFTLVDENPQKEDPYWAPSNCWSFEFVDGGKGTFDLRMNLSVIVGIDPKNRGVVFVPRARGPFVSASDRLPNFRMFKLLVESDPDAPVVAKELAESDGTIVVTWAELGLGGIRRLPDLFMEFMSRNDTIDQLGKKGDVFDPAPYPRHQHPGDELFILEPAQTNIVKTWRAQLTEYRSRLVV